MTTAAAHLLRRVRGPLLLTLTAAILIVLVASLSVSRGDGGVGAPLPQETPTEDATPEPTETGTEPGISTVEARVTSYEVFLARDPFEPVIPEPVTAGGGTGSPTTTPTTSPTVSPTTVPTTSPTTAPTTSPTSSPSPTPSPTPGATSGGCVSDGTTTCDGQTVALVDVFTEDGQARAVVRVNETLYEVVSGEQFATSFRALSIEAPCVTLQYGDDSFTLCEGESILK